MDDKKKIIAVVQCRMGSQRLPGKVMKEILGRPMLWYIMDRLKYSSTLDDVVIATSERPENRPIVDFSEKNGFNVYAGEEEDLIDRFYQAAKMYSADLIVRITADCPLVDPGVLDDTVNILLDDPGKYVYVSNARPAATFPHGLDVEVLTFDVLEELWKGLTSPFRREWFTTVLFEDPVKYPQHCLKNPMDLSWMRLTVDYPEDMELVRYIFGELYSKDKCFYLEDIKGLEKKDPGMFNINRKYTKDEAYFDELKKRGLA